MRKTKKSILNLSFSLIYKLLVVAIGLVLPRMFILQYGSELNGLQSSVNQIFTYIALIEAGVGEAALQALYRPVADKDRRGANEILSATTKYYNKIGIIYFIILFALAAIYPLIVPTDKISYLNFLFYIIVSGATTGLNFFFVAKITMVVNAEGDTYWTSILQFFVFLLTSVCRIFCIMQGYNILVIQLGYFAVNMLYTLALYIFAKKKYPWISFKEKPNLKALEQKNSVLLHKISGIVFQNTDVLILTFFCDLETVSIYGIYKLVANSILSIISMMTGSVTFALGQTLATDKEKYKKLIDVYHVYYTALSFAVFAVTYVLYLPFVRLYTAGSDIIYVDRWLPVLFILIELLMIGREAMMLTITVAGHFKQTLVRSLIESGINLTVSIVAVIFLGIYGVLLGTVAALLYRTIDINLYANKRVLGRSSFNTMKVWISNLIVFAGIALLFDYVIKLNITNYLSFIIAGLILSVVFVAAFIIINSLINIKEFKLVCSYFGKRR